MSYAEQQDEWAENYGQGGEEEAAGDYTGHELYDLMLRTGEWLELLFGDQPADCAMRILLLETAKLTHGSPLMPAAFDQTPWRELWSEDGLHALHLEIDTLPISQLFTDLNAYAFDGLTIDHSPNVADREAGNRAAIKKAREIVDMVSERWGLVPGLKAVVTAAEARDKLDRDQRISPNELAAIARVGLKTVRNALAPSSPSDISVDGDGLIAADRAMNWLSSRDDFRKSVWQVPLPEELQPLESDVTNPSGHDDEYLFVPVARDKTWFSPDMARAGVYQVGPKSSVSRHRDYFEALGQLTRMDIPQWRRPNQNGHWGVVSGVAWKRVRRSDLLARIH